MPRKANYPEWVTRHLKTGQYVNKKGDSYYIYSAHSERREGISHPVRVSDGYLGRITEKDGFIPAKKKRKPPDRADSTPLLHSFGLELRGPGCRSCLYRKYPVRTQEVLPRPRQLHICLFHPDLPLRLIQQGDVPDLGPFPSFSGYFLSCRYRRQDGFRYRTGQKDDH